MSTLAPWLSLLAAGVGAFFVGMYFQGKEQKERQKRREIRERQMADLVTSTWVMGRGFSARQALHPKQEPQPQGLEEMGRVPGQFRPN